MSHYPWTNNGGHVKKVLLFMREPGGGGEVFEASTKCREIASFLETLQGERACCVNPKVRLNTYSL
jgi:hypothetical protein